jgi:hypothetical protein
VGLFNLQEPVCKPSVVALSKLIVITFRIGHVFVAFRQRNESEAGHELGAAWLRARNACFELWWFEKGYQPDATFRLSVVDEQAIREADAAHLGTLRQQPCFNLS